MSNQKDVTRMQSYRSQHNLIFIGLIFWSLVAMPMLAPWIFLGWILNCFEVKRANRKIRTENQLASQAQALNNIEKLLQQQQQEKPFNPVKIRKYSDF